MISDETRELLSAYVDGELRESDAARVEQWIKRDPELQRELQAYRTLGDRLRTLDAAATGSGPSAEMDRRALRRVRAWMRTRGAGRRARGPAAWARPLALAAALLLVATAASVLALSVGPTAPGVRTLPPPVVQARAGGAPAWVAVEAHGSVLPPAGGNGTGTGAGTGPGTGAGTGTGTGAPARARSGRLLSEALRGRFVDGTVLSDRAITLRRQWEREQAWLDRMRAYEEALPPERRSTTRNAAVAALLSGYEPRSTPYASLVAFRAPEPAGLPPVGPIPLDERAAREGPPGADDPDLLWVSTVDVGRPVLTLAGEIWIGERDGSGRTRVVTQSNWITDEFFATVVWADRVARPDDRSNSLTLQPVILGPEVRRRLVGTRGRDEGVRRWLAERFGGRSLARVLAERADERERAVERLVTVLAGDASATGFAVLLDGEPLGCELFASHELMVRYAPRLLRGYMLEAGTEALDLAPKSGGPAELDERVRRALDTFPERATRLEEDDAGAVAADWPEGLRRVTLREPLGAVVGHGLLLGNQPVALSLFE